MRQLIALILLLLASALDALRAHAGSIIATFGLVAGTISAFRLNNPILATLTVSGLLMLYLIYLQIRRSN